jgi:hypothetical protein
MNPEAGAGAWSFCPLRWSVYAMTVISQSVYLCGAAEKVSLMISSFCEK